MENHKRTLLLFDVDGTLTASRQNLVAFMGDEKLQSLINFALGYLSNLTLPCKRGTFVEFRNGMINFCPVGRSCSQAERQQFSDLDQKEHIREEMVKHLREKFTADGWEFSIGGQISIDAFPIGWDKRYCLQYLEKDFDTIHFFGDKVEKGGNDHEIYSDPRTIGHRVMNPPDTKKQVLELLSQNGITL
ncbi:probable phosphomannomutase isoform X2 [Acanthaster planci]|uniref:Phosphomannomutase n=1 Tax=Acanthaster planci TaxID=133434 RepID=A0A8B7Y872_ACAPL|nr:probable phosphomannomutase isoform X2 [Acanthaster planci]